MCTKRLGAFLRDLLPDSVEDVFENAYSTVEGVVVSAYFAIALSALIAASLVHATATARMRAERDAGVDRCANAFVDALRSKTLPTSGVAGAPFPEGVMPYAGGRTVHRESSRCGGAVYSFCVQPSPEWLILPCNNVTAAPPSSQACTLSVSVVVDGGEVVMSFQRSSPYASAAESSCRVSSWRYNDADGDDMHSREKIYYCADRCVAVRLLRSALEDAEEAGGLYVNFTVVQTGGGPP